MSNVLVGVTVLCAVVSTALLARRELSARPGIANSAVLTPTAVPNWRDFAGAGHRMGSSSARVTILEFADFECPVCRNFTTGPLRYVRAKYPNDVQVIFRHWPLQYHRFAYPTARAAECAGQQGRFEAFHDLIYDKQDSLGLKSYSSFAHDAGVPDSVAFTRCNNASGSVAVIDEDTKAAKAIGGRGTPAIVINGKMLGGAPDSAALEKLVRGAIGR